MLQKGDTEWLCVHECVYAECGWDPPPPPLPDEDIKIAFTFRSSVCFCCSNSILRGHAKRPVSCSIHPFHHPLHTPPIQALEDRGHATDRHTDRKCGSLCVNIGTQNHLFICRTLLTLNSVLVIYGDGRGITGYFMLHNGAVFLIHISHESRTTK